MSHRKINSIIEGCMPDTPRQLMYTGIELDIPKNANVLFWSHEVHPLRYLLYGKTKNFTDLEIINNPFFQFKLGLDVNKLIKGGLPLRDYDPKFRQTFDTQRSITTRDGRIYIKALHFQDRWRRYLDAVQTILKESGEIFRGEKTENDFYKNPSGAW